jgi:hypothetical protein
VIDGWWIGLKGEAMDVGAIADLYTGSVEVSAVHDDTWLRVGDLGEARAPTDALERGEELLALLNGGAQIYYGNHVEVTATCVVERVEHGCSHRTTIVRVGSAISRSRVGTPTLLVKGVEIAPAPPPPRKWFQLALVDEDAASVLRLLRRTDLSWSELYYIYDLIVGDVGSVRDLGWATKAQTDRFRRTANSRHAVGDASRHGREVHQPPRNPMTIDEARAWIRELGRLWLDARS